MTETVNQLLRKAEKNIQNGDFETASGIFKKILQRYPENRPAKKGLKMIPDSPSSAKQGTIETSSIEKNVYKATQLLKAGELASAKVLYEKIVGKDPHNTVSLSNLAYILEKEGDLGAAELMLRKVTAVKTDAPEPFHNLARVVHRKGDINGAIDFYEKALAANPNYELTLISFTRLLLRENEPAKAEKIIVRGVNVFPNNALYRDLLGTALKRQNKFKEALTEHRRAVAIEPTNAAYVCNLGNCLAKLGMKEESEGLFVKAIELDKKFALAYINLAYHHQTYTKSKGLEKAEAVLVAARENCPESDLIYMQCASVFFAQKKFDEAFKMALQAIKLNPGSIDANVTLAEVSLKLKKYDMAQNYANAALQLAPKNIRANICYGEACVLAGKFNDALAPLDVCIGDRYAKHAQALALKSIALRETGQPARAEEITDLNKFVYISKLGYPPEFSSLEEFNLALENDIKSHPSLEKAPFGFAARNSYLTNELQTPLFQKMELLLRSKVQEYIEQLPKDLDHTFIRDIPNEYFMRIWGTLSTNEGFIDSHIHNQGWISAAYYLKLPESVDCEGTEGWIEFGSPPSTFDLRAEYPSIKIKPELGTIILFPSFYYHRTLPYSSNDERMSISFDLQSLG